MRFKIDENLPVELVAMLRNGGHDAMSVTEQGLGGAMDEQVAERCIDEDRAIVSLDLDFADIRRYPPSIHRGLIVLRLADQQKRIITSVFTRVISLIGVEPLVGRLWIVDEAQVRIRGD